MSAVLKKARRIGLAALGLADHLIVPPGNLFYGVWAIKSPKGLLFRLDSAISQGIAWFQRQDRLTADAAVVLRLMINPSFDPRLGALDDKIRAYAMECHDPHLRLLDESYNPRPGQARALDLEALHRLEKPIVRCLYPQSIDAGLLEDLEALDDRGNYGTTHKLLGCVIARRFRPELRQLEAMIESAVARLARRQSFSRATDLSLERTVLLQWLGYDRLVQPGWIVRILRAQLPDGGWSRNGLFQGKAQQHPSCLALTALVQYRERLRRGSGTSLARPSEIGRALDLSRAG